MLALGGAANPDQRAAAARQIDALLAQIDGFAESARLNGRSLISGAQPDEPPPTPSEGYTLDFGQAEANSEDGTAIFEINLDPGTVQFQFGGFGPVFVLVVDVRSNSPVRIEVGEIFQGTYFSYEETGGDGWTGSLDGTGRLILPEDPIGDPARISQPVQLAIRISGSGPWSASVVAGFMSRTRA